MPAAEFEGRLAPPANETFVRLCRRDGAAQWGVGQSDQTCIELVCCVGWGNVTSWRSRKSHDRPGAPSPTVEDLPKIDLSIRIQNPI